MSNSSRKTNKYIDDMAAGPDAGETSESGWETASAEASAEDSPDTSSEKHDASSSIADATNAGEISRIITTRSMAKGPAMRPLTDLMSDMQSGMSINVFPSFPKLNPFDSSALSAPQVNNTSKQSLSKLANKSQIGRNLAKRKKMPHWTAQAGPLLSGFDKQRQREEQKQAQRQLEVEIASVNRTSHQKPAPESSASSEQEEHSQAEAESAQPVTYAKKQIARHTPEVDSAATSDIESTTTSVASPAQNTLRELSDHSGSEGSSAGPDSPKEAQITNTNITIDAVEHPQSDWSVQAVKPSSGNQAGVINGHKYQPEFTETGTEIAPSREPSSIPPDPTNEPKLSNVAPSVPTNSEVPVNKPKRVKFDLPEQQVQHIVPQEAELPPPVQRGWLAAACSTTPVFVPPPKKPQKSVQIVQSRATPVVYKQNLPHTYAMSSLPVHVGQQQTHPPYNPQQQQQEGWMQAQPMYQNQAVYPQYPASYAYQYSPPMQAMPFPMYQQQAPQQMYPVYPPQHQYPVPAAPQFVGHHQGAEEQMPHHQPPGNNSMNAPQIEEHHHVERPSFRSSDQPRDRSTKKRKHKHEHREKDAYLSSPSPPPRESPSRLIKKKEDNSRRREESDAETGSPRRRASEYEERHPEKHLQAGSSSSHRNRKTASSAYSTTSSLYRKLQKQEHRRAQRPSHQEMYAYSAKRGGRIPNDLDAFGASEDDSGNDWSTLSYAKTPLVRPSTPQEPSGEEEKIIPSVYKKFQPSFTPKVTREALEAEKRRAAEEAASKQKHKSPYGSFDDDGQGRKVSAFSDPAFGNSEPLLVGKKKRLSLFRPPSKEEYEAEQRKNENNNKRKAGDLAGLDDRADINQDVPSSDKENVSERRGGGAYSFLSQMGPSETQPKYVSSLYKRSKLDNPAPIHSPVHNRHITDEVSSPAVEKALSSEPDLQHARHINSTPPTSPQPATPASLHKAPAMLSPAVKRAEVSQSPKVHGEEEQTYRSPINKQVGRSREQEIKSVKQPSAYSRFFDEPENEEEEVGENNISSTADENSDTSSRKWSFW